MDTSMYLVIVVGLIVLCGILYAFQEKKGKKPEPKQEPVIIGQLLVDATDPEKGGGVYLNIRQDPKTLTDGEIVQLEIIRIVPQEKQMR